MKPFVIGLTGPIGCGKTNVLRTLVDLGAEGIDADKVAHEVMAPGGAAYASVLEAFGAELLGPGDVIDRQRLGEMVFTEPAALARLEAIVHPAVSQVIRDRIAASAAPVVVIEAIKLIEAGISVLLCDAVWVAVCSPAEQLVRLSSSRGMSAAEVDRRAANQMPAEKMIDHADRVINTDGTVAETVALVRQAWLEMGFPLAI
jgi:dephospho-CoA kinase